MYGLASTAPAASLHLQTGRLAGDLPVKDWKTLRDARVVKQDLDYSCGAASLATVLSEFYGESITEDEVMHAMESDGMASFKDLAYVAWLYGYQGQGLALDFEKLKTLKIPAIAYVRYRGEDHFTVIRGIGADGWVAVADPSWGNRQFTETQSRALWETREDERQRARCCWCCRPIRRRRAWTVRFSPSPRRNRWRWSGCWLAGGERPDLTSARSRAVPTPSPAIGN